MHLLYQIFIDPFMQMGHAPDLFVQTLWEGLVAGVLYALIALGFVLIFKASGVFNFAQGIMVVFAALTLVGFYEFGMPAFVALALTIAVMLALALGEAVAGYLAGSLALVGDAGHNFTDSLALVLAWFAFYVQSKPPTRSKTYGYHRAGVLAAFVNALLLVVMAVVVFYEAYHRLMTPHAVDAQWMMIVGGVGFLADAGVSVALLRQGRGRIVNIGSIAGRSAMPFVGPYSASKFALEALTDVMRLELRSWGIHVSIVEPGAVESRIWDKGRQRAVQMEAVASPEAKACYGEAVAGVREAIARAERHAIPARAVARAVAHALRAARPKTRYLVGLDARLRAVLAAWLPDRVQDWLLAKVLRLPR